MMMIKITGLDGLTKILSEVQKAMEGMDGEFGSVSFDPHDPGSVDVAIHEVERLVDEQLGAYASNPMIGPMIAGMKERYRQGIIDRAAAARVGGNPSV